MKKAAQIFFYLVCLFLIVSFLGGVMARDNPANVLLERLAVFMQERDEGDLEEALGFTWDEICIFYLGGSESKSAYWAYEEVIQKKISEKMVTQEQVLPAKSYSVIFLVTADNQVYHYATIKSKEHLLVGGKEYWLNMNNHTLGGCLQGDARIKKDDDLLLITARVDKT